MGKIFEGIKFVKRLGPPMQAVGPPRSDAGMGIGMLRGKGTT